MLMASFVIVLLKGIRPSAIIWLIVTKTINAINTVFVRWHWPHVSNEVFKRIDPSVTHSDTFRTVVFITGVSRVVASSLHVGPRVVLTSDIITPTISVGRSGTHHTTTRSGVTRSKVSSVNGYCTPTLTSASPRIMSELVDTIELDHREFPEFLTGEFYKIPFRHHLFLITPAGLTMAAGEFVPVNDTLNAALTHAQPFRSTASVSTMETNNSIIIEYLTCEVVSRISHFILSLCRININKPMVYSQ